VSGILEMIRIWRKLSVLAISSFSTELANTGQSLHA
jgi:hypothetical protein